MSFSEALLSADGVSGGKSRFEEMHPEMEGKQLKAVDGERVGDTLQAIADKKEEKEEKKEKVELKKSVVLPKETQAAINESKKELKAFAENDPTLLAEQDRGAEAINEAKKEVLRKWP